MPNQLQSPSQPLRVGLEYPCGQPPGPGELVAVAEGIYWLRMPVPGPLNHINLWMIEGPSGWTVIDTGMKLPETHANWETILDKRLGGKPVELVVVTHMHPDHVGMAGWLCERYGAPLAMSLSEYLTAMLTRERGLGRDPALRFRHYVALGMPEKPLEMVKDRSSGFAQMVHPLPESLLRLSHGQRVRLGGLSWQVMVGHGHSPEHVSLWCPKRGILIAGDQVLPKISTNVAVWASIPQANALQDFLDSMRQFHGLPEDTLVLPSHGEPFLGLHHRLTQLAGHHDERLAAQLAALREVAEAGMSAWELALVLFPTHRDSSQVLFAFAESLAHIHCLEARNLVRRETDGEGSIRFFATPVAAGAESEDDAGPIEVEGA